MVQPSNSDGKQKTVIIIGGGLAGTFLTIRCLCAGFKVYWWNSLPEVASSQAAAGLFNIYSGRNLTQTWHGQEMRNALHDFFNSKIGAHFKHCLHLMPLYRPFTHEETQLYYFPPQESSVLSIQQQPIEGIQNQYGGMWIHGVGWLNVPEFIRCSRSILPSLFDSLVQVNGFLDPGIIDLENSMIPINTTTIQYDEIFFCEGLWAEKNILWRPYIYLTHLKGQLIKVKTDLTLSNIIVNNQAFMIPHEDQIWTVGATYEHRYDDISPTEDAKIKLLKAFKDAFSLDIQVKVIAHWTGIRPTTPDQKPIIGRHPIYANLWILNGLGTKGVLYSCYGSELLVNTVLTLGKVNMIPMELRPARWKKKKSYD